MLDEYPSQMTSVLVSLSSAGSDAVQLHSTSSSPYDDPWFVQRMASMLYRLQMSCDETHLSCGTAETRRFVVLAPAPRSVNVCTSERRMAFLFLDLAARAAPGPRANRRRGSESRRICASM